MPKINPPTPDAAEFGAVLQEELPTPAGPAPRPLMTVSPSPIADADVDADVDADPDCIALTDEVAVALTVAVAVMLVMKIVGDSVDDTLSLTVAIERPVFKGIAAEVFPLTVA